MTPTKSFTKINYLQTKNNLDIEIFKELNFRFTSKKTYLKNILETPQIGEILGLNETNDLKKTDCYFYSKYTFKADEKNFNNRKCLIGYLHLMEFFCQTLWLVKDNSVHCELGHLLYENSGGYALHSNYWKNAYYNAIGKEKEVFFSKEELKLANKLFPLVFNQHFLEEPLKNTSLKLTSNTSRLTRAFIFLNSARCSEDLGTKISIYCSVFESLFSVSTTELRHRLSETIAFFLETESNKRKEVYDSLKLAYDVRSSVVHGDGVTSKFLKNDFNLLLKVSTDTDKILRRCFRKILDSEEYYLLFTKENKTKVGEFLQNLMF